MDRTRPGGPFANTALLMLTEHLKIAWDSFNIETFKLRVSKKALDLLSELTKIILYFFSELVFWQKPCFFSFSDHFFRQLHRYNVYTCRRTLKKFGERIIGQKAFLLSHSTSITDL
jgi:hypothetical protein